MMTWKELPGFRTYWEFFERSGLDANFECIIPSNEMCETIIRAIGEIEYREVGAMQRVFFRGIRGDFQESGVVREVRRYVRNGEIVYYARIAIRSRFQSGRWGSPYFMALMLDTKLHPLTYTIVDDDGGMEKIIAFNGHVEVMCLENALYNFDEMMEYGKVDAGVLTSATRARYSERISVYRDTLGLYWMHWVANDFPWSFSYVTEDKYKPIRLLTCYFEQGIKGVQELFAWKCESFGYRLSKYDGRRTRIWRERDRIHNG